VTEPFAKVREVGSSSELVVAGESIKWTYAIDRNPHRLLRQHAASINTAARKYAADKIREAAAWLDRLHTSVDDLDGVATSVKCLRSRANTVEIGEA